MRDLKGEVYEIYCYFRNNLVDLIGVIDKEKDRR